MDAHSDTRTGAADRPGECGFSQFFRERNRGEAALIDRCIGHNISFVIAYLGCRCGFSPNHLSLLGGGFTVAAFVSSLLLSTNQPTLSILVIFALAQLAYLFDCADGQLARTTGTTSEFGHFLDRGVDALGVPLSLGALFCFLFRLSQDTGQAGLERIVLVVGFVFLIALTSRFCVYQDFANRFEDKEKKLRDNRSAHVVIAVSLMGRQVSLFGMIVAIFSIQAALALYAGQAVLQLMAYVRYFVRARRVT